MKARYYLFGTKEESISYDILTAHAERYVTNSGENISAVFVEFQTTEDRVNAIEMLNQALKPILMVEKYKAMSYSQQREIDKLLFQALVESTSSEKYNYPLKIEGWPTRRWDSGDDERPGHAYTTLDFTVTCVKCDAKAEDEIEALTNIMTPVLLENCPQICHPQSSMATTKRI